MASPLDCVHLLFSLGYGCFAPYRAPQVFDAGRGARNGN